MAIRLAPGVIEIDTQLAGWSCCTAAYLLEGSRPLLVEVGSQSSVPRVLAELEGLGIGPRDLAGIALTHIHLDHAGGVGDLARAFPNALIYVHPSGASHLVDPTKLLVSAERVFGEMLDRIFGRLLPTEASRIVAIDHLQDIAIGPARLLTALHTPGHAKHHVAFHDSESGLAFVGDAVGVRLPEVGVVRPATPPPDFDVEETVASIRLLRDRSPSGIAFAHYGLVDDSDAVLQEGEEMLHRWTDVAVRAERCGLDIDRALGEHFDHELLVMDERAQEKINALNGTHSNAAGFRRWLSSPCGQSYLKNPQNPQ